MSLKTTAQRFSKALAALLGALTPAGVITLLSEAFNVHISVTLAGVVCAVSGAVATALAPANKEPE